MPREQPPRRADAPPRHAERGGTAASGDGWHRARAQAEPIAALIAVSFIVIAVGIYAGYLADALPGQSAEAGEGAVADQVWDDLQQNGTYPNETYHGDRKRYPEKAVDWESLPPAENVYVVVTTTDDQGNDLVVGETHFGHNRNFVRPPADPPERARTEIRSVPVEMGPGVTRGGTMRVEVW